MPEDVQSSHSVPRMGEPVLTDKLKGGIIITVLALLLLGGAFYVSNPLVPAAMALAVALIGIATAVGLVPVRAPQDYYGGLALVLMAIFAVIASAELPGQRGFAFGPGTAPRLFAIVLAGLGAAVALVGVFVEGPRIEKYKIRGPALVLVGISLFAALIRPFGLVTATYLAFIISIMGSKEMRWIESLIAAAAMTLGCVLLFVYLLNLPFQLWPQSNALQLLLNQFGDILKTFVNLFLKFIPAR
jgi:putative tricarboxylic transport membrane protein